MTEKHHTPEQVEKAFAYAPTILRKLKDAGVPLPSFTLYEDASGRLNLGTNITNKQYDLAVNLIRSRRESMFSDEIAIDFCCSLVTAAEELK